nr:Hypothetical protein [Providencia rettgeri]
MGLYPLLYVGLDIRLLNLLNMTLIKTALSLLKNDNLIRNSKWNY